MINRAGTSTQRIVALCCAVVIPVSLGFAQTAGPYQAPVPAGAQQDAPPLLSADQLDNLVAPVALYPDPLLSQVLAASTYPLEVVEAQQWLALNANLQGAQLMDAAKLQNWDPSVQALVAFPDALKLLNSDVRWTTDLGNAFLAQQSDVMNAVQTMRARAQLNGRLATTPQQVVTMDTQDNQSAIEIMPADPQIVYVPTYNPAYVWGPPVWGAYPDLWYPDGFGFGFGFGPGIYISSFFPGWGGWGGWGWGCGWFGNALFVNTGFFNRYGFRGGFGGGFGGRFGGRGEGRGAWAHDPGHRMGVPYPSRTVAGRFNSSRFVGNASNGRQAGGRLSGQAGGGFNGRQAGNAAGNRQFSDISRRNAAPVMGARSNTSQIGGLSNRSAVSGGTNGGWRRFNGSNGAAATRSAGVSRQASPNISRGNYQSAGQYNRASGATQGIRSQPSYNRSSAPSYSASRGQNFSAQRFNAAPSRSFSAPTRSYSAPSRSFSGTRSFSAPRSSGGSSGFSGGHSGFSGGGHTGGGGGGHAGGGGGHGGGGRR